MTVVKTKKAKGTKKCAIKRRLKFENYKYCLEATQLENKGKHLEKNEIDVGRMQSIDSSKDLVSEKEDIKCTNIIKRYKK